MRRLLYPAKVEPIQAPAAVPAPDVSTWVFQPPPPQRAWAPILHPARLTTVFVAPAIVTQPLPDPRWRAQYPDRIDRQTVHASPIPFLADTAPLPDHQPTDGWRPRVADWIARRPVRAADPPVWIGPLDRHPTDGWRPSFPDRVWRTDPFATTRQAFAGVSSSLVPPPGLGWAVFAPDRIEPPAYRVAPQPTFTTGSTHSSLPIPDLAWQARYPARIDRNVVSAAVQRASAAPDRLPIVPAPDLAWGPSYPSFARTQVLLTAHQTFRAEAPAPSVAPLGHVGWLPSTPDQLWTGVLPRAAQPWSLPIFAPVVPPSALAWYGTFAAFARAALRIDAPPSGATPVAPQVAALQLGWLAVSPPPTVLPLPTWYLAPSALPPFEIPPAPPSSLGEMHYRITNGIHSLPMGGTSGIGLGGF